MKPFVIRDEYFGGSVLNRNNMTFSFLDKNQLDLLCEAQHTPIDKLKKSSNEKFIMDKITAGMISPNGETNYEIRDCGENTKDMPRGILKSPLRLYFEITKACNLRCNNCFSSSGKPYEDELTHSEVIKILDNLRKDDVLEVRFTGGEPTRRKDWKEIVGHAKDIGMGVSMNTNGVYDSSAVRDEILDAGVDQVILSLDGNKKAHEVLRGKGNFEKTLESIEYLSNKANNVRINTILNEGSLPFVGNMAKMADDYKTELCFILLRPVGRGEELFSVIPSKEKLFGVVNEIENLKKKYKNNRIFTSYDVIQSNSTKPAPDLDITGCAAGLRGLGINSRGRVECCGFVADLTEEYNPGNVRDHDYSLLGMWRSSPEIEAFRKKNREKNAQCVSCSDYKQKCYGSCATMEAYKQTNARHKDPYCFKDF